MRNHEPKKEHHVNNLCINTLFDIFMAERHSGTNGLHPMNWPGTPVETYQFIGLPSPPLGPLALAGWLKRPHNRLKSSQV